MSVDSNTPLDPRIQLELEKLNSATDNINRFEVELEVSASQSQTSSSSNYPPVQINLLINPHSPASPTGS